VHADAQRGHGRRPRPPRLAPPRPGGSPAPCGPARRSPCPSGVAVALLAIFHAHQAAEQVNAVLEELLGVHGGLLPPAPAALGRWARPSVFWTRAYVRLRGRVHIRLRPGRAHQVLILTEGIAFMQAGRLFWQRHARHRPSLRASTGWHARQRWQCAISMQITVRQCLWHCEMLPP